MLQLSKHCLIWTLLFSISGCNLATNDINKSTQSVRPELVEIVGNNRSIPDDNWLQADFSNDCRLKLAETNWLIDDERLIPLRTDQQMLAYSLSPGYDFTAAKTDAEIRELVSHDSHFGVDHNDYELSIVSNKAWLFTLKEEAIDDKLPLTTHILAVDRGSDTLLMYHETVPFDLQVMNVGRQLENVAFSLLGCS